MTAPTAGGPTSVEAVQAALSDPTADVAPAVAAVNSYIATFLAPGADGEWASHHRHGAAMLAVRVFRRKDSPAGVLPFGMEGVAYVARTDPDVAMFLGLGSYAPPRVG